MWNRGIKDISMLKVTKIVPFFVAPNKDATTLCLFLNFMNSFLHYFSQHYLKLSFEVFKRDSNIESKCS